jgi:hypothetical protein
MNLIRELVTFEPARITEDEEVRITENNINRIIE